MFCSRCGKQAPEETTYCGSCGAKLLGPGANLPPSVSCLVDGPSSPGNPRPAGKFTFLPVSAILALLLGALLWPANPDTQAEKLVHEAESHLSRSEQLKKEPWLRYLRPPSTARRTLFSARRSPVRG